MERFADYYKILEVHYDASPEVIRAAYHKLSSMYHPDGNTGTDKMAMLNVAYDTLSDEKKRMSYNKKWLKNFSKDTTKTMDDMTPGVPDSVDNATGAMEDFFFSLLNGHFERAYSKLTDEDKQKVSLEEFVDFRKAVDSCFEMRNYSIKLNKIMSDTLIGSVKFKKVYEFAISVKEYDRVKIAEDVETTVKFAVYDGNSFKIVLGMYGLKNATNRYRLLAERTDAYDPVIIYKNTAKKIDFPSGLLSIYGLTEELEKEFYRSKRYRRPLTCMSISSGKSDYIKMAGKIKNTLRVSDIAGVDENYKIIIILPETDLFRASLTEKKITKILEEGGFPKGTYTIRKNDAKLASNPEEVLGNL